MTLVEGQAILNSITYKPGWSFKLTESGLDMFRLLREDSTRVIKLKPGETLTISRHCSFALCHIQDAQCLIDIVHSEVVWLEMHEVDEWFKVTGKLWHNPHASGRDKALNANLCIGFTAS